MGNGDDFRGGRSPWGHLQEAKMVLAEEVEDHQTLMK